MSCVEVVAIGEHILSQLEVIPVVFETEHSAIAALRPAATTS